MDPQHLKYYEQELQFVREMGAEYAKEFPKIAGRLGIDGIETSDPYVERLLESFAFLTARVHLRLDAEYPKFTQNLLEVISPQYLTPVPATAMVEMQPIANAGIEAGFAIPRNSAMRARLTKGQQTACEFRSVQSVQLWPLQIAQGEYFSNISAYAKLVNLAKHKLRAGLRLSLQTTGEQPLNELSMDKLQLYLAGQPGQAMRLYEQIFANTCAVVLQSADAENPWLELIGGDEVIEPVGFKDDESLLPLDSRCFSGYRLLREYFIFPERFLFFRIKKLAHTLQRCFANKVNLVLLFDRHDSALENRVTAEDFKLHCTPVINLFDKRLDNIQVAKELPEYHIVADRTRPMDFEIFSIEEVSGYGSGDEKLLSFQPLYSSQYRKNQAMGSAYFSLRRERRMLSSKQKREGTRSPYIGSETYLSVVDASETLLNTGLKQLTLRGLCTNRDLPFGIKLGHRAEDFSLESSAPVDSITCLGSLNPPQPSLAHAEGDIPWRLVNMLSLNYMSLVGNTPGEATATLRELLSLLAGRVSDERRKQIEGIVGISSEQVTRRLPSPGPMAFARGLRIEVVFEEYAFKGSGLFLLGAILDRFFARSVSVNSFTETVLKSTERGVVKVWPVRIGQRRIL